MNCLLDGEAYADIITLIETQAAEGRQEMERKTLLDRLNPAKESAREQAIDRALAKGLAAGALVKVRKGVYQLPPEPQSWGSADKAERASESGESEAAEHAEVA